MTACSCLASASPIASWYWFYKGASEAEMESPRGLPSTLTWLTASCYLRGGIVDELFFKNRFGLLGEVALLSSSWDSLGEPRAAIVLCSSCFCLAICSSCTCRWKDSIICWLASAFKRAWFLFLCSSSADRSLIALSYSCFWSSLRAFLCFSIISPWVNGK